MGEEHARRIPTELEIEVLQHIADGEEGDHSRSLALVICALVCKAWLGYARSYLYYSIDMNHSRGKRQFERLHEYTHLRAFLREFTWPQIDSEVQLNCHYADYAGIIKDIAPTVKKLRLRILDHNCLEPSLKEAIFTFTNINELDMTLSMFEDWTTVVRIVSSFPFLATLAMPYGIWTFEHDDDPEIPHPPPPSCLVHIKLASGCETQMVSWICTGSPIPNIQTVEAESKVDSYVLAKLLRSLGGRLRHLIIHIDLRCAFLILGSRRHNSLN
jgi:hypothetical protein